MHQYYFSPAPEPPATPVDGTDNAPSPTDARASSAAASATGKAVAAPGAPERGGGFVPTGWADAIAAAPSAKANGRNGDGGDRDGPGQMDGAPGVPQVRIS